MIIEFVRAGNVSLNDSSRIMYVVAANSRLFVGPGNRRNVTVLLADQV